jgi:hypothetical protein
MPPFEYLLSFDGESDGLHGEVFAIGAAVLDRRGAVVDRFRGWTPPPPTLNDWCRQNLPRSVQTGADPHDPWTQHRTAPALRAAFWTWLRRWLDLGALVVADCGWPVEAGLLSACVADAPAERAMRGPYPLHELATLLLAAGQDPVTLDGARYAAELLEEHPRGVKHDPNWDALVSGLCALVALGTLARRPAAG